MSSNLSLYLKTALQRKNVGPTCEKIIIQLAVGINSIIFSYCCQNKFVLSFEHFTFFLATSSHCKLTFAKLEMFADKDQPGSLNYLCTEVTSKLFLRFTLIKKPEGFNLRKFGSFAGKIKILSCSFGKIFPEKSANIVANHSQNTHSNIRPEFQTFSTRLKEIVEMFTLKTVVNFEGLLMRNFRFLRKNVRFTDQNSKTRYFSTCFCFTICFSILEKKTKRGIQGTSLERWKLWKSRLPSQLHISPVSKCDF